MKPVIIIGCGDIGRRVAALEHKRGRRVMGLARSARSADRLRDQGIHPLAGDLDDPPSLRGLPTAGALVYYFAPPPDHGRDDPRMTGWLAGLEAPQAPARVLYISTSGVYGDCDGAWVTEQRPVNPQADRARRRVAAENALRAWSEAAQVPIVVLRVAGIYGPGRLPLERLRRGLPVLREEESPFSNRVHADDLAQACVAAADRGLPGAIYNIADDQPTTMTDYFYQVADAVGLPRPPALSLGEARATLSAGMLSYLAESRRLDNRKMREELGVSLRYPDLARGLASCMSSPPVRQAG